jgi:antitoxin HicB
MSAKPAATLGSSPKTEAYISPAVNPVLRTWVSCRVVDQSEADLRLRTLFAIAFDRQLSCSCTLLATGSLIPVLLRCIGERTRISVMALAFRVHLIPDSDKSLLVTCPALPEVTTFGEDWADAMRRARNAIEEALAARMRRSEDVPLGETHGTNLVRVTTLFAFKAECYRRKLRRSRAELIARPGPRE